jgi:hypothetical protein
MTVEETGHVAGFTEYFWTSLIESYFWEHVSIQCVQKVALHLQKVLEAMSMSIYTGLNPFNFIRKHFLQICL